MGEVPKFSDNYEGRVALYGMLEQLYAARYTVNRIITDAILPGEIPEFTAPLNSELCTEQIKHIRTVVGNLRACTTDTKYERSQRKEIETFISYGEGSLMKYRRSLDGRTISETGLAVSTPPAGEGLLHLWKRTTSKENIRSLKVDLSLIGQMIHGELKDAITNDLMYRLTTEECLWSAVILVADMEKKFGSLEDDAPDSL